MKCPVCNKTISESTLKCPYCKTRLGLLCSHCNTVNSINNFNCKKCGSELLKVCPHCNGVNYPSATKCRKCGSPFAQKKHNNKEKHIELDPLKYIPEYNTRAEAIEILTKGMRSKDKKIFSISGEKGTGKTSLLKQLIYRLEKDKKQWCVGKCSHLTQLSPGGVLQNMFLNLFNLPSFCVDKEELSKDIFSFFTKEFSFLKPDEINDFINFLYNSKDGNYEDIIINKKKTFGVLIKILSAFADTGKFIFVIDNFDFIDGFSIELLTNFIRKDSVWKNLKLIVIYNEPRPVSSYFGIEDKSVKSYTDINLAPLSPQELEQDIDMTGFAGTYITDREREVIISKSGGNPAFANQAVHYCFDCQISDNGFLLPTTFSELIKARLELLLKTNKDGYKFLCACAVISDKISPAILQEAFNYSDEKLESIIQYLTKSGFISKYDNTTYEFSSQFLWETIVKNIPRNFEFEDVNMKIGRAINLFSINTNPTMAMIAHNLRENKMSFDIWTKITRLCAYIGDINLYVIAQKQCLALLNEFNENETVNIRYNISERLGKILSEYDPEEAKEFLPDAIAHAKETNNKAKEIELLGYLAMCALKSGNYFGSIECADQVLKNHTEPQSIEYALICASKLPALLNIGNCAEVVNLIDNDILPVLNKYLTKPKLNKVFPIGFVYETWTKTHLILAQSLAMQGDNRCFKILKTLFGILEKQNTKDYSLIYRAKLVKALACTMKGDFSSSEALLNEITTQNKTNELDNETLSKANLVDIISDFMLKRYDGVREKLFEAVTFANNVGDNFTKNILKTLLGKLFSDGQQTKHAIEIYNEQARYFASEKMALGALLTWTLIADANIITETPKSAVEIASQALEIAQNPKIDNKYFIVLLKMVLAKSYIELSDFQSAKISIDEGLGIAKKYEMEDLLSKLYFLNGKYLYEMGKSDSQNQADILKGSLTMYTKALEIILSTTNNHYLKSEIDKKKAELISYCDESGIKL